jgi:PmbA protein
MNKKERLSLAKWVIDRALKNGADQAAVAISNGREIEVEYRDKKLEKLQESTSNSLSLQIYAKKRFSGHSTNDLRKSTMEKFIDNAVSMTGYLTEDPYRSLVDPKYYPSGPKTDLRIRDYGYEKVESAERVKMAAAIEAAALAQSDQIISVTSGYSDSHYETLRMHSNGFIGESEGTGFSAGAEVTVKDGESGRPEDWYYASTRFLKDLPPPEVLGKSAAERALRKIGQDKIESGVFDMIVENRAGSRLYSILQGPMAASALQQKNSFLEGMLGQQVASEILTVTDDPFVEAGLGSRWFDSEGIAAKRRVIIDKGILKEYYVDNYYGKKLGMEPNSGSTGNVLFEQGTQSLDEMIKSLQKGILITGFVGGNSNSTTGDFSFGITGMLIEDGKAVKPINEMNISGNVLQLWKNLVAVGGDPYPYSSWRIPSMHFKEVQFSGI